MLATIVEIPAAWLLTAIVSLGTAIATLAATIFHILKTRLDAQDRIIEFLKADVNRLTKGCGVESCVWRGR
jgi:hypothetical protein